MAVKGILLDTNAYVAFKRNQPEVLEILNRIALIGINSIVLGELLSGFAVGTRETTNRAELEQFLNVDRVRLFRVEKKTAEQYAIIYRNLKRKGQPIPTNDIRVAATALENNLAIFSYDRHFQAVDGIITGSSIENLHL